MAAIDGELEVAKRRLVRCHDMHVDAQRPAQLSAQVAAEQASEGAR